MLWGTACASVDIPNIRLHAEIPFKDGAEAAYIETVSQNRGLISHEEWVKLRPYMFMMHIDDWAKIKKGWLKACRSFRKKCNVTVDSIDEVIIKLDSIIKEVVE